MNEWKKEARYPLFISKGTNERREKNVNIIKASVTKKFVHKSLNFKHCSSSFSYVFYLGVCVSVCVSMWWLRGESHIKKRLENILHPERTGKREGNEGKN